MTFKQKIASIFVGFVVVLTGVILFNLNAFSKIDGHAQQINDAGSLRMRTYKITMFVNQYTISDNAGLKNEAISEIKNNETKLKSLKVFYEKEGQREIVNKLNKISSDWESLKVNLQEVLNDPAGNAGKTAGMTTEANRLVAEQIHPIVNDMQVYSQSQVKFYKTLQVSILVICLILSVIIGISTTKALSRSIIQLKNLMSLASNGDLTVQGSIYSKDELGSLTKSFNDFITSIRGIVGQIVEKTVILKNSSDELLKISENMGVRSKSTSLMTNEASQTLENMSSGIISNAESLSISSDNLNVLASTVEEISGTIKNLSAASGETSSTVTNITDLIQSISNNINELAVSTKEISSSTTRIAISSKEFDISLNEISHNCERSRNITGEVSRMAKDTGVIISALNDSSKQIGKIINLIDDIAGQTNMLALNAAIEAAGAGEAGKGFAVVANEVKGLAKQTSEATTEISGKIINMQNHIENAVKAVDSIQSIIDETSLITITIASAVTEQAAISNEISKNVNNVAEYTKEISQKTEKIAVDSGETSNKLNDAAKGVSEIARSVSELYIASNEASNSTENVSRQIRNISASSIDISRGVEKIAENVKTIRNQMLSNADEANNTRNNSEELSKVANKLEGLVKQFRV